MTAAPSNMIPYCHGLDKLPPAELTAKVCGAGAGAAEAKAQHRGPNNATTLFIVAIWR